MPVRGPESFRGGCSFGGGSPRLLPALPCSARSIRHHGNSHNAASAAARLPRRGRGRRPSGVDRSAGRGHAGDDVLHRLDGAALAGRCRRRRPGRARITTMRSTTWKTWWMLWAMKMQECPELRAPRTKLSTPWVSATPRLLVGSSRMIRSLSKCIARAMATAWRSPPESDGDRRRRAGCSSRCRPGAAGRWRRRSSPRCRAGRGAAAPSPARGRGRGCGRSRAG